MNQGFSAIRGLHASCGARGDAAVLLFGPAGSGKSDLLLRLLDRGFDLVADDRVLLENGHARPPEALAGLIEIRGLGLLRVSYRAPVPAVLAVELDERMPERLPMSAVHAATGLPLLRFPPFHGATPLRIEIALDCVIGRRSLLAGAITGEPS